LGTYLSSIRGVAISYDGKCIAVASDRYVYFFDENGGELWRYTTIGNAEDVAVSADGERIVVVDDKSYVNILDEKGNLLWDKKVHEDYIITSHVAISSNGERMCFGMNNLYWYKVGILDKDGNWILKPTSIDYGVREVAMTKDGKFIAVASQTEYIYLLNDKGKTLDTFKGIKGLSA
jgi:DNA-binding beta-propeller fold protein YncE